MTSIARPRPTPRRPKPQPCDLECQLSKLRSQTDVWDLSTNTKEGRKIVELTAEIEKKNERLN